MQIEPQISMLRSVFVILFAAVLTAGCDRSPPSTTEAGSQPASPAVTASFDASPEKNASGGIDWHTGNVESAFALAREQDKPLFLYWGAAWCPPCHQIKDQIFSRPEFIAKSKLFVPVYLDGDTERAQKYGEQFGVRGYPTMIVFSPDGRELTRIPGGLDIGQYADVLDLTLEGVRPVSDLVLALMNGEEVSADDYRLLGFYSWSQDNERALAGVAPADAFHKMWQGCPPGLEAASARLYAEYLRASIEADKDAENPFSMSDAQKSAAIERVKAILADEALSNASLPLIISYSDDVVSGLTDPGSAERESLVAAWNERLDAIADNTATSVADRLWTRYVKLNFATLDSEDKVPESMAAEARAEVDRANQEANSQYQRQSFMNAAWYVLTISDQSDYARELLLQELEKSKQPYYFMPSLAKLAEEDGDTKEALGWLKRGYDTAEGPATRFQWGYYYVDGLIRMTPDDGDTITAATEQLLSELEGHPDAIYNRTGRIMKRLGTKLAEWNVDGMHDEQVSTIQLRLDALCAEIPEGDEAVQTCRVFMEEA